MSSYIVIPARLASTRLPRKLLLRETGKTLIQHTYEAARRAAKPAGVIVATDHEEIAAVVRAFRGQICLTSPSAASGTDRVAEVAAELTGADIIVNVQGDEPEIKGSDIDLAISLLERDESVCMSTLATPIRDEERLFDPSCVKVVVDQRGHALYFSRSPIPHPRDGTRNLTESLSFLQHIGLYAYRRDFLLEIARTPPGMLEQIEKLEQLRVLEAGHSILVGVVPEATRGIDTPDDYAAFVRGRLSECGQIATIPHSKLPGSIPVSAR